MEKRLRRRWSRRGWRTSTAGWQRADWWRWAGFDDFAAYSAAHPVLGRAMEEKEKRREKKKSRRTSSIRLRPLGLVFFHRGLVVRTSCVHLQEHRFCGCRCLLSLFLRHSVQGCLRRVGSWRREASKLRGPLNTYDFERVESQDDSRHNASLMVVASPAPVECFATPWDTCSGVAFDSPSL